jgi:hypothetical protein
MTHEEIVNKIIGNIDPVGETNTDNKRFANLQAQCELVQILIAQIEHVARYYTDSTAFSVKRAGNYADKFLKETINVKA